MDETGGGVCCNMEAPHGQGTWIGEDGDHHYTGESHDGEYHGCGRLVQGGRGGLRGRFQRQQVSRPRSADAGVRLALRGRVRRQRHARARHVDVGERGHASEGWLIEGHSHGPVAVVVRDGVTNAHVFGILGRCGSL